MNAVIDECSQFCQLVYHAFLDAAPDLSLIPILQGDLRTQISTVIDSSTRPHVCTMLPCIVPEFMTKTYSHILYAFANIKGDTGEVFLSDTWSDQDIHYPGDSWNDSGKNLYGNFKAIYKLKKEHRHLKVLLSIGGWTYSPTFHPVVVNPALRSKFVASAVRLLEDNGLDGLDIDYEYPQNDEQARGYVELLRELRRALDQHAQKKGANYKFLLTVNVESMFYDVATNRNIPQIAAPCGPDNYNRLHVREMDQQLDFWNMMAYDFCTHHDPLPFRPDCSISVAQLDLGIKSPIIRPMSMGVLSVPQRRSAGTCLEGFRGRRSSWAYRFMDALS